MSLQRMYKRYGGLMQSRPLTEEEEQYDDTCLKIDALEQMVGGKSMALFTASEFMWFSWFVNKTFFGPKQNTLDEHLKLLTELLDTLNKREAGK